MDQQVTQSLLVWAHYAQRHNNPEALVWSSCTALAHRAQRITTWETPTREYSQAFAYRAQKAKLLGENKNSCEGNKYCLEGVCGTNSCNYSDVPPYGVVGGT